MISFIPISSLSFLEKFSADHAEKAAILWDYIVFESFDWKEKNWGREIHSSWERIWILDILCFTTDIYKAVCS